MAARIVNGTVYDTDFAKKVGGVYERTRAAGNCCRSATVETTHELMKRLDFRDPKSDVLDRFVNGKWAFKVNEDAVVETDDYFLVVDEGHSAYYTDIVPMSRDAAFEWACDNLDVGTVIAEFGDLVTTGHLLSVETKLAEMEYKRRHEESNASDGGKTE